MNSDAFEDWWSREGQFCRSGGGDYEKSFAFAAWNAAKPAVDNIGDQIPGSIAAHHLEVIKSLQRELGEADRRAGAAERLRARDEETLRALSTARSKMKAQAGYDDNVSFDVVWADALAALLASRPK